MIYLLRHGLDDERYVGGHSDVALTSEGIKQVEKSAFYIKNNLNIKKIYTSDVLRARQTTNIINKYLNVDVIIDKNLRELDKGLLTGKLKDNLTEKEKNNLHTKDINEKIIGGESMQDFYDRIITLFKNGYFSDKDNSLIVTHRGVINMLYYYLNKDPLTMDKKKYNVIHGSIHELDLESRFIKRIY